MKHGILMWGAQLTSANNGFRFTRTTGVGASSWTAALTTAPTVLPDWIPSGSAVAAYDLLANLKAAMDLADPNDTYEVSLQADAVTGMTGRVVITNEQGNSWRPDWTHAAMTVDPSWFGFGAAQVFSPPTLAVPAAAVAHTGNQLSSLLWAPQRPFWEHELEPMSMARTVQSRSISGRIYTRSLAVRTPKHSHRWGTVDGEDYGATWGGRMRLVVRELEHDYVHVPNDDDYTDALWKANQSLEVWWDHARQGKWFIVVEDNAAPGLTINSDLHFARLTGDGLERYDALVRRTPRESPMTWDLEMEVEVVDLQDLGAGGS